jgi:hypothetical protein
MIGFKQIEFFDHTGIEDDAATTLIENLRSAVSAITCTRDKLAAKFTPLRGF